MCSAARAQGVPVAHKPEPQWDWACPRPATLAAGGLWGGLSGLGLWDRAQAPRHTGAVARRIDRGGVARAHWQP
jgi:hypothetical protein